jgi:hypothetical protein
MWPALIMVDAPRFDLGLRILERCELVDVEAFVSEPSVERLAVSASRRNSETEYFGWLLPS